MVLYSDPDGDCDLCGTALRLAPVERRDDRAVCTECGAPYGIVRNHEREVVTDASIRIEPGDHEWEIVATYYEDTGQPAVLYASPAFDVETVQAFEEWAVENEYDAEMDDAFE